MYVLLPPKVVKDSDDAMMMVQDYAKSIKKES